MSIYTDFDATYGNYYAGIPTGDGTIDVFSGGQIVDNISANDSGIIDGDIVFKTSNIDGGLDTFVNGTKISHTQPNIYGGEDTFSGTEHTHTTIPNEQGGSDVYGEEFHREGTTFANVYGSEDYLHTGGNVSDIMRHEDPLSHAQNLKFPSLDMATI